MKKLKLLNGCNNGIPDVSKSTKQYFIKLHIKPLRPPLNL